MSDDDGLESPPAPECVLPRGAAVRYDDGALRLSLATKVYPIEGILRSCYWLTDRCFVYVSPSPGDVTEVTLLSKTGRANDTNQLAWDFLTDLIDQCLRLQINAETRDIRTLIVAQAFADVDLIDDRGLSDGREGSGQDVTDQRGIKTWRPVS